MKNPKTAIIISRLKAFAIDYLIIFIYIGLLLGVTLVISNLFDTDLNNFDTTTAELTGFFTLTLPVILYFTFTEAGKHHGSIGKRKFGLEVVSIKLSPASFNQLLFRNIIKFLPWEIAHFFIFQLFYFSRKDEQPPGWVLAGLIISQAMAVTYLLFILSNKNNRSIYEIASGTKVVSTN
jgi:uncharacterized RDD family membrane protein YckC